MPQLASAIATITMGLLVRLYSRLRKVNRPGYPTGGMYSFALGQWVMGTDCDMWRLNSSVHVVPNCSTCCFAGRQGRKRREGERGVKLETDSASLPDLRSRIASNGPCCGVQSVLKVGLGAGNWKDTLPRDKRLVAPRSTARKPSVSRALGISSFAVSRSCARKVIPPPYLLSASQRVSSVPDTHVPRRQWPPPHALPSFTKEAFRKKRQVKSLVKFEINVAI